MDDLRTMLDIVNNISDIHKRNSAKNAKDHQLCANYGRLTQWITIGVPIVYLTSAILYNLPAFLNILTQGIIRPSLGIYLPAANQYDNIDMSVLLLVNLVAQCLGFAIFAATDPFILINFSTITMFSTIIQRDISDFNNKLKDKKTVNDFKLIKQQMIEIMKLQLKYNE